ncbi:MAG: hypothetical protein HY897_08360 [Deltaproteobacteria bacterium]|nr:hypothetical protein [Deltaproteobacteria bacterium]
MKHSAAFCRLAFVALMMMIVAFVAVCGDMGVATIEDEDGAVSGGDRGRRDGGEGPEDRGTTDTGAQSDAAEDVPGPSDASDPSDTSYPSDGSFDSGEQDDAGGVTDAETADTGQPGDGGHPGDTGNGDAGHGDAGHGDTGHGDGGQPGDAGHPIDTGHPDTGGTPDAGATCTLNTGIPACNTCLRTDCVSRCATCQNNPACVSVFECGLLCDPSDTACLDACATQYPGGAFDGANLYNCAVSNCQLQCVQAPDGGTVTDSGLPFDAGFLPDGGSVICNLSWGSQACSDCFHSACSSQCQNCAKNADCVSALMCVAQCPQGDMQCWNGCVSQYPGSFSLLMALYNCMSGNCGAQCGL